MPELNLVELGVSQVENGVKAFQAAGALCTKVQRQERIHCVRGNICSVWLKHKEQKGVSGDEAREVGRGRILEDLGCHIKSMDLEAK